MKKEGENRQKTKHAPFPMLSFANRGWKMALQVYFHQVITDVFMPLINELFKLTPILLRNCD